MTPNDSFALQVLSGDRVSIDQPIKNDDVFVSAGTVDINSPVSGAIILANVVNINAPINGDLFVTANKITVNSDVSEKIVAAGNNIDIKGKLKNAILAGNHIQIYSTALISKDAYIAAQSINNDGNITGRMVAFTDNFQNKGDIGKLDLRNQEITTIPDLQKWLNIINIVVTIGFAILGIILIRLLPIQFDKVRHAMNRSIIKNTVVGFLLIIVFVIVIFLSAITVVGLPIAAFGLLVLLVGLMMSSLFVSFAIGNKIIRLFRRSSINSSTVYPSINDKTTASATTTTRNNVFSFLIGFVLINLLYIIPIPYFTQIIQIIIVSMGFGSIYYAIRNKKLSS